MSKFFNRNWKAGFTLVELIVVIAILAILAGIAIPVYSGYIKKANEASDNQLLAAVNTAFAAACVENGEYDMKNLSFTPTASLNNGSVTMNKYNADFQRYYSGNSNFKFFDVLVYVKSEGVFKGTTEGALVEALTAAWNGSSFSSEDGSSEAALLAMFDEIQSIFGRNSGLLNLLVEGAANNPDLNQMITALGIDGLNNALNLSESQLQAIVAAKASDLIEGYDQMTEDEKAAAIANKTLELEKTIQGNAAVLYVASDATGHTTADIQSSLGGMMSIMAAAQSGLSDEQLEAYLEANVDGYTSMTAEEKAAAKEAAVEQLNQTAMPLGGVNITNGALLAMQQAMQGNTAIDDGGVSTLGALFALTQGFYSDPNNYTGDKPPMNGGTHMLEAVFAAISDEKFMDYYNAQGAADITAYLDAMSVMAAHSDEIDMTSNNAFTEQYAYLAEILGITNP